MGSHTRGSGWKPGKSKTENTALRIKLRGRDNAPLPMTKLREGLLEAGRLLQEYDGDYRVKFVTIYLTMIDERGDIVRINRANELTLDLYDSAADEFGIS